MRITLDLPADVYALAKSMAEDQHCTLDAAVNLLLQRSVKKPKPPKPPSMPKPKLRNGFVVSPGAVAVTPEMVKRLEAEADAA